MAELGAALPSMRHPPPGPASRALAERLAAVESRNVTRVAEAWPVFWEAATGANVRDADGNVYLDLTAAFGVALAGHAHPRIGAAVRRQSERLVHGMGDVHPPAVKVELLERLAAVAPWSDARGVLATSGSEAVEIGLKTALLATGRPGVVAFEGGYHGLTIGALAATGRAFFREPFEARLHRGVARVPWPTEGGSEEADGAAAGPEAALAAVEAALRDGAPGGEPIGAVILEPVQGRGGVRLPPAGFLAGVAGLARAHGALVVADEIFTGMGRCGRTLASERYDLVPDILCLGKALGGGLPLSACLAPRRVMDAWPPSSGEALHTSTFLGHPLACAAGLAVLDLLDEGLAGRAEEVGVRLRARVAEAVGDAAGVVEVRGVGAMIGVELAPEAGDGGPPPAVRVAEALLADGVLVLPAGAEGRVVELTPPVVLTEEQIAFGAETLGRAVRAVST